MRGRSVWLWLLLAVLVILLLGLLFGGYRRGTRIGAPENTVTPHPAAVTEAGPAWMST
jgi:hypothetical protein